MKSFKNDFLKDNTLRSYIDLKISEEANLRTQSDSNLQTSIQSKINSSEKGISGGVATLDSNGILVTSQRPSISYSGNVFIFRPGETSPYGNIFRTWSSLTTAVMAQKGIKYIEFDDSLQGVTVPVDNFSFSECILSPRFKKSTPTIITFSSGFLVSAWPLDVQSLNLRFSSHFFDNIGTTVLSLTDSILEFTGSTGNGIDFSGGSMSVFLRNSSIVGNGKTVFSLAGRSLQIYSIYGLCSVDQESISGAANSSLSVTNYGANFGNGNSLIGSQNGFLGIRTTTDYTHTLEKTLTQKGQILTRDGGSGFVSVNPGQDNDLLIYDSTSNTGLKASSIAELLSLPGMKSISEFVRQVSPFTGLYSAGSRTLDCSLSNLFRITGGNATITLSNMTENQVINVVFESTGSAYSITWTGGSFLWPGAVVPTPTATASRRDLYTFIKVGGNIFGSCVLNMG
ncbi:hypothetical protein [Leptospira sanjuanensis]|uniref:hypothetical protein n=1 Tax=Leptospira sanjuanensis TaxID=2879643 RepID=UPI001EE8ADCC|nr:hypothetical protein [Leptospira sanjuanensis]MCG6170221.1 hypothetical protein [Leptospira sanjuanensis]